MASLDLLYLGSLRSPDLILQRLLLRSGKFLTELFQFRLRADHTSLQVLQCPVAAIEPGDPFVVIDNLLLFKPIPLPQIFYGSFC